MEGGNDRQTGFWIAGRVEQDHAALIPEPSRWQRVRWCFSGYLERVRYAWMALRGISEYDCD